MSVGDKSNFKSYLSIYLESISVEINLLPKKSIENKHGKSYPGTQTQPRYGQGQGKRTQNDRNRVTNGQRQGHKWIVRQMSGTETQRDRDRDTDGQAEWQGHRRTGRGT